jgi:ATP-binding cassette subfamily F protein 3
LAAFAGPQLLILDEPTNHLDIDSRGELIEAINEYEGACVIVSHDRRLLEACVDRLWLVADGAVKVFDGDVADYSRLVLAQRAPDGGRREPAAKSSPGRESARPRRDLAPLRREIAAVEEKMRRFEDLLRRVDEALAVAGAGGEAAKIADLASKRGELERALTAAEEIWLDLASQVEAAG